MAQIFKLSEPTSSQVITSVERVVAVFLVASFSYWVAANEAFSKSVGHGAILAGITAVYQLVASTLTTV